MSCNLASDFLFFSLEILDPSTVIAFSQIFASKPIIMSFLACPLLCHQFGSTLEDVAHDESRLSMAIKALEIMDMYLAVSPHVHFLVDFLNQKRIATKYNQLWVDAVVARAEKRSSELYGHLLDNPSQSETYKNTMELLAIYTVQNRYGQAISLLETFATSAAFTTDAIATQEIVENKYFEYLLFLCVLIVYKNVWFEDADEEAHTEVPANFSPDKDIETHLKRANFYHFKHKLLLTEAAHQELRCYWLLRWLAALVTLGQESAVKFVEEFDAISESESVVDPLDCMNLDEFSLREPLLLAHGLAVSMVRPFSTACHFDSRLTELYSATTSMDPVVSYLVQLKDSQFIGAKQALQSQTFRNIVALHGGYALPREFLLRLQHTITFKVFILIMQTIKRIPRSKIMLMVGLDETAENSRQLLLMLSVLELAHFGVGYNTKGDFFYNTGQTAVPVEQEVDRLAYGLQGESMSAIINAALLEQIHQA